MGMMKNISLDMDRFETGEMTAGEEPEFFQKLIDTGIVWNLIPRYIQRANTLIQTGLCKPTRRTLH